ncbi:conserved hypothetical protein [gamma proteobacterium NOR5-3]|nr:conserved hypothetical protein [gamma proteobacterium NOR5-3]
MDFVHAATATRSDFSPYVSATTPNRLLWGDTHLHTSFSSDAALLGNTLGPDEAYSFARGKPVTSSSGLRLRLLRPLDFLVIADHSENLGLAPMMRESNPDLLSNEFGRKLQALFNDGRLLEAMTYYDGRVAEGKDPLPLSIEVQSTMWQRMTRSAENNNVPGVFSTLIGYEWSGTPGGSNLHRNVVYRDGSTLADQILPFTAYQSTHPEHLWDWMEAYEATTGGRVLAIPHNGNLSNGLMFDDTALAGPIDAAYARRRARWEPVYEVTQMKGDGESHPRLSPNDEFADFETWDTGSFVRAKKPDMIRREYAREALKRGLEYSRTTGANPFQFGLIGSTDSHTSLSTSREENFFGKAPPFEPSAGHARFNENIIGHYPDPKGIDYAIPHARASASGLTAVWATDNTRADVWDALKRREVYATTGTRMSVRLFAGGGFQPEDLHRSDLVSYGYSVGVPMGGELNSHLQEGDAPAFVIHALRDPDGANLDRIQVIKGWVDEDGRSQERIFDVAVSGDRKVNADGRCLTPVGNTVDVARATYSNDIGAATLSAYWKDPDFNSSQSAFYYLRVLEIPTPRWVLYDHLRLGTQVPEGVALVQQERAYTSPVWYTP